MARYRGWNRRRSAQGYAPAPVAEPVDELLAAANAASERRNQENYAWVADFAPSDKRPGDAERRKLRHYERLIQLVGDADTAWRKVAERDGVEYKPCVDCGWLPRYTAAAEMWRLRVRAIEAAESNGALCSLEDECEVSS